MKPKRETFDEENLEHSAAVLGISDWQVLADPNGAWATAMEEDFAEEQPLRRGPRKPNNPGTL